MSVRADVYIHASSRSLVETEEIGAGTKIWSNVRILAGARIGRECVIGTNVFIDADVVVGDRVKIQNGVSLYRGVVAEDGVFFGPHCTTTNDLDPAAITPEGKLKGPEDWTLGRTLFREGARVGAHATVLCGDPLRTIGRWALVGAHTLVTHDVPDFALVTGVPGHVARYVCPRGLRHRVELVGSVPRCGECGQELRSIVSRR
ncbi:MAG TPA: acyltransferase [Candidatus Dormibacteraeota bacterium]|jgi:acetyltransferase-like isoleucine patch superfamily enzyme|nr:acyltransferase [Candidatus Dormibacteraeota bacterium]